MNLERTLKTLEQLEVVKVTTNEGQPERYVELADAERKCGRENYDFYCFLIWPFIEASWLGAVSLLALTPPEMGAKDVWIDMKTAQDVAQLVRHILVILCLDVNLHSSVKPSTTKAIWLISRP